jgi:hypothetical protein
VLNAAARGVRKILGARKSGLTIPGVELCEVKMPEQYLAFTVGEYVFVNETLFMHPEALTRWVRHEVVHVEQSQRYGWGGMGFVVRYFAEQFFVGYAKNRYEIEARRAENHAAY